MAHQTFARVISGVVVLVLALIGFTVLQVSGNQNEFQPEPEVRVTPKRRQRQDIFEAITSVAATDPNHWEFFQEIMQR